MAERQGLEWGPPTQNVAPRPSVNKPNRTVPRAEHKPIQPMFSPEKVDLASQINPKKISPNTAEQKEPSNGLADLSKLMAEKGIEIPQTAKKRRKPRHKKPQNGNSNELKINR